MKPKPKTITEDGPAEAVEQSVRRLLRRRAELKRECGELKKRYRQECGKLNSAIGRLLDAWRRELGARLKELTGDGFPVSIATLSGHFHGDQTWNEVKALAIVRKLRVMQQQQKGPRP